MKLTELLYECGPDAGIQDEAGTETEISSVCRDADDIKNKQNCLFAVLHGGERGIRAAAQAAQSGNVAALLLPRSIKLTSSGIPVLCTDNPRRSFAISAAALAGNPQKSGLRCFAVTGTNGKTSTTFITEAILSAAGRKCAVIGTTGARYNGKLIVYPDESSGVSQMTTPDPEILYPLLAKLKAEGIKNIIMEASSHALELEKLSPMRFAASVFTNLSREHLDFHGNMDNYRAAKLKLAGLSERIIYNADDSAWRAALEGKDNSFSFGIENGDYSAYNIRDRLLGGIAFTLSCRSAVFGISTRLPGLFSVYNTLAAAALALSERVHPIVISESVKGLDGIDGRMERVPLDRTKCPFSVYIDFAHTEAALRNLLISLSGVRERGGRIVTLFGCGGERDREKRAPMGRAATELSDFVYITSDNSRSEVPQSICNDIVSGIEGRNNYVVMPDRREAIRAAVLAAQENDLILLVGKGHENYEIDARGRRPFSEKEIVCAAADERYIGYTKRMKEKGSN